MILRADTYIYDECRVAFFKSASEPQEVLVAPMYLVLTRVKLAPCGLEREATNQHQTLEDLSLFLMQIIHRPEAIFTKWLRHILPVWNECIFTKN